MSMKSLSTNVFFYCKYHCDLQNKLLLNMFKVFDDLIFFQFSYSIEATFPCIYIVFSFKFIMYAFWYNGFHYVLEKILKISSSKKHFLNILLNMYNKKKHSFISYERYVPFIIRIKNVSFFLRKSTQLTILM